jgi:PEP-CTERM motif
MIKTLVVIAALAFGSFATANADPIVTGTLDMSSLGNGTTSGVTFSQGSTVVTFNSAIANTFGTGTLAAVTGTDNTTFYSFNFGSAPTSNEYLFSSYWNGVAAGLVITNFDSTSTVTTVNGATFLNVSGEGYLQETGYQEVLGDFTLTASSAGGTENIGFQSTSIVAPTPEPASLALFGTGLLGVVGIARRKFKV